MPGPPKPSPRLCRLVLVRAGRTLPPRERGDPPLSDEGRQQIEELRHHWEWAQRVVSSPLRRAVETARLLAGRSFDLDSDLRPLERSDHARVAGVLESLVAGPHYSVLVVSHQDVLRAMVEQLVGGPLPEGRPEIGELVLLTRPAGGRWRLGRRSSDPEPLRSALERTGLRSSHDGEGWDEQHIAPLELRRE